MQNPVKLVAIAHPPETQVVNMGMLAIRSSETRKTDKGQAATSRSRLQVLSVLQILARAGKIFSNDFVSQCVNSYHHLPILKFSLIVKKKIEKRKKRKYDVVLPPSSSRRRVHKTTLE